jgi:hypothetical protein
VVQNGTVLMQSLLGPHHLLKRIAVSSSNCDTWYARVHTYRSLQPKMSYAGSTEPMHAPLASDGATCTLVRDVQTTDRQVAIRPAKHVHIPSATTQTCLLMPQTTCVRFCRARQEFLTTHLHPYSRTDVLHQDVPTDQCPGRYSPSRDARLARTRPRFAHDDGV